MIHASGQTVNIPSRSDNTTSSTDANQPSLEETLGWLKSKLPEVQSQYHVEATAQWCPPKPCVDEVTSIDYRSKVTKVDLDGCKLKLSQEFSTGINYASPVTHTTVSSFSLPDVITVSQEEVSHEEEAGWPFLWVTKATVYPKSRFVLAIVTKYPSIHETTLLHVPGRPPLETSASVPASDLKIEMDDGFLAPRLVKALQHAVELCKISYKPEPF